MNRTSTKGLLFSILAAIVPACNDDNSPCMLDVCGTGCVDLTNDPNNCGSCFNECGSGEVCVIGTCGPSVCDAPEELCGDACVDTQTSIAHCGACDAACAGGHDDCVAGLCASPLVAIYTRREDGNFDFDRDLFVVQDISLEATQLGVTTILGNRVRDHRILPDGRVLLVAAQETEDVFELWLSSPRGGAFVKLSSALVAGGNVLPGLAISADGSKVLYRADGDVDGQLDLYAVALATPGATVKVNGALVAGREVSRVIALSANGQRATYIADQDTDDLDELYTVDLSVATPGPSVKLNAAGIASDIWDFQMTNDGSRVLYRSDHDNPGSPQLFVVDVATPGVVNPILNTIVGVNYRASDDYRFTADETTVIYASPTSSFDESLYTAPATGTIDSAVLAENTIGSDGEVRTTFALTQAGVVYFRKDVAFGDPRLFRVDLATPNVFTPVFDGTVLALEVDHVAVSPNGNHLVFGVSGDGGEGGVQNPGTQGGFTNGFSLELYYVDLTATLPATPVRIASTLGKGQDGIKHDFFVRDDARVIFRADLDLPTVTEVYIGHPSAPDTVIKISPTLDATIDATDVRAISRF